MTQKIISYPSLLLVAISIFLINLPSSKAEIIHREFHGKKIVAIDLQGLGNTAFDEVNDILKNADVEIGKPYSDVQINTAIKQLINRPNSSVYYGKVDAENQNEGVKLIFHFKERPRIKEILFRGNEEIYETELRDLLPFKEGDILREHLILRAKNVLLNKYQEQGLFLASIRIERKQHKNNTVDIIIVIDEGENIKVREIRIIGLENLREKDLISEMDTEVDGFIADGSFSRTKYLQDRTKIINYMRKMGYRYADITSNMDNEIQYFWIDEKQTKRGIRIQITVKEGKKYYFDKYSVKVLKKDGDNTKPLFDEKLLMSTLTLTKRGELFDNDKYQKDRQNLSMLYASRGHIFARIIPNEILNKEKVVIGKKEFEPESLISVHFEIIEGPVAKIENVFIKGNKKTKTHVIQRELLVKSGEVFNSFLVQRSRERIYNLGFFKEVNLDAKPGSREPYMNLIIDVVEQPTGTISMGGGYGTQSGFSIFTEIAENNLLGNGQRLSGRFEYGPLRKQIQATFSDPWIIDNYPLSFYISAYYVLRTYPVTSVAAGTSIEAQYDKSTIGSSLGFGYRFWIFWGANIRFGLQRSTAVDATGAAADAIFQQIDLGPQYRNSVSISLYRDTRDNVFNTVNGLRTFIELQTIGWFGDDHYKRWNPMIEFFFSPFHLPFLRDYPTVIYMRASGDFTMPPLWYKSSQRPDNYLVELDDKLYVGGVETVRGWNMIDFNYSLMPKQYHWRDGGDHRILYGLEYRIPIEPRMLWFVSFVDAGALWDAYSTSASSYTLGPNLSKQSLTMDSFVYSWGFGIRVQIPVMPIRLYMAQRVIYRGKMENSDTYYGFRGFSKLDGLEFVFGIGDMRY